MKIEARLDMGYDSEKMAVKIQQALKVDDGIFVSSQIKNNMLHAYINAESLSSFLQTIDDYLSCLSVAERIIETKKKSKK